MDLAGSTNVMVNSREATRIPRDRTTPGEEQVQLSSALNPQVLAYYAATLENSRKGGTVTSRTSLDPPALRPETGVALLSPPREPPSKQPEVTAAHTEIERTLHEQQEVTFTDNAESYTILKGFPISLRGRSTEGARWGWSLESRGCGGRRVAPRSDSATWRMTAPLAAPAMFGT